MRANPGPRWSVNRGPVKGASVTKELAPASMAGLPGKRARVWVGPPLSWSGPWPGLLTLNRLPVLFWGERPPEPPVPKRLVELLVANENKPATSSGGGAGAAEVARDDRVLQDDRTVIEKKPAA
jgi:hypothetical protein